MNKTECDICMDLIPLVADGAASEKSTEYVEEHIKECEICRSLYESIGTSSPAAPPDSKKIAQRIRRYIYAIVLLILAAGTWLGVTLTTSAYGANVFYNIVLMPIIGGLSAVVLNKKALLAPVFVFIVTAINFLFTQEYRFVNIAWFGTILSTLCLLGVAVVLLLKYAFLKGDDSK